MKICPLVFLLTLFTTSLSSAQRPLQEFFWKKRQAQFERLIRRSAQDKIRREKLQKEYTAFQEKKAQYKKNLKLKFLNQRFSENLQEKSKKIFKVYMSPKVSQKDVLKKKFLKHQVQKRNWKKKYSTPLEQEFFF